MRQCHGSTDSLQNAALSDGAPVIPPGLRVASYLEVFTRKDSLKLIRLLGCRTPTINGSEDF